MRSEIKLFEHIWPLLRSLSRAVVRNTLLRQRAGGATSASLTRGAAALCTLTGAANPSTVRRMWHCSLRVDGAASGERAWQGPGHHGGAGGEREEASTWDGHHSVRREKLGCESSGHYSG